MRFAPRILRFVGRSTRPAAFAFLLILSSCSSPPPPTPDERALRDRAGQDLADVRDARPAFSLDDRTMPLVERRAWEYYGLDLGAPHHFGFVDAPTGAIALHAFHASQESPRGTIFLVHGYYDHVGIHARSIAEWLDAGWSVVAFDLPGHGLSDGPRADIEDFADYAAAFEAGIAACRAEDGAPLLAEPWHLVAHSTGCAVVMARWLESGVAPFERHIFAGPLVRSAYWGLSKFGNAVVGAFTDSVVRTPRVDSSDAEFLRFRTELDPLRFSGFPLGWFDALRAWNARFEAHAPFDAVLLVVQGDRDDTVSWRHNLRVLREKVPGVQVEIIEGGRHQLLGEAPEFREPVMRMIAEFLRGE